MFLSGWVANYPEHVVLQNYGFGLCPWYEVGKKELDRYIDILVALCNYNLYQALYNIAQATLHDAEDGLVTLQNPDDTIRVTVHQLAESSSNIDFSNRPVVKPITYDPLRVPPLLESVASILVTIYYGTPVQLSAIFQYLTSFTPCSWAY
jgi:hypothetical protein